MDIENKIVKVDNTVDVNVTNFPESQSTTQVTYIKNIVYVNGLITYLGKAAAGTATSDEAWQICRFIYDDDDNIIEILFAEGSTDFIFEMDEYENYDYS